MSVLDCSCVQWSKLILKEKKMLIRLLILLDIGNSSLTVIVMFICATPQPLFEVLIILIKRIISS